MTLQDLQDRVGTRVAEAVGDPRLERIITRITGEYAGSSDGKLLDLCHAEVALVMATEDACFFSYSQGTESMDKTMTPKMFLQLAQALWEKNGVSGPGGEFHLVSVGRTRRTEEL